METELIYIFRIILSSLCGAVIGIERRNRSKEAGIRTHCIVACASSVMMLISKYGFFDTTGINSSFDGTRIAAQIVSGIGFLGAGMIFVHKNTITGLTTAAGVWATAGIGMAIGSGMYIIGLFTTAIIIFIQVLLHKNNKFDSPSKLVKFYLSDDGEANFQRRLYEHLESLDVHIYSADVSNDTDNEVLRYTLTIEIPSSLTEEDLVLLYANSKIISQSD